MDWKRVVARIAAAVERRVDARRFRDRGRWRHKPLCIEAYRGYGTRARVYVRGRVLEHKPVSLGTPHDTWWTNLKATVRLLDRDEVPHARVRACFRGGVQDVEADEEGYFEAAVAPTSHDPAAGLWHEAELQLLEPATVGPVNARAQVLIPPPTARFGVISDIDDTVLRSDATRIVRMAVQVLFGNVHTRLPFPGIAAFYRALQHGGSASAANPIFYVSSSPWNLHGVLVEFFRLQRIPAGPLLLRDWGLRRDELPTGHASHKLGHITRIFDTYPDLPFVLIGDSGQEDPEIYRRVIHDHPNRVLAAYIRSVHRDPLRDTALRELALEVERTGAVLLLADNTLAAARHAAEHGWIPQSSLADIAADKRHDERPGPRPRPEVVVVGEETASAHMRDPAGTSGPAPGV